jgi:hypothetical protein
VVAGAAPGRLDEVAQRRNGLGGGMLTAVPGGHGEREELVSPQPMKVGQHDSKQGGNPDEEDDRHDAPATSLHVGTLLE